MEAAKKAASKIPGAAKWISIKKQADILFGKFISKTSLSTFDWIIGHTSESFLSGEQWQKNLGRQVDEFLLKHGLSVDDLYNAPPV